MSYKKAAYYFTRIFLIKGYFLALNSFQRNYRSQSEINELPENIRVVCTENIK